MKLPQELKHFVIPYKSLTDLFSSIVHFKTRRRKNFLFSMLPDIPDADVVLSIFYNDQGYGYCFYGLSDEEELKLEPLIGNLREMNIETKNMLLRKLWNKITKFLEFLKENSKFNIQMDNKNTGKSILDEVYKGIETELEIKTDNTNEKELEVFTMKYLLEKGLSVFDLLGKPIKNRIWIVTIRLNNLGNFPLNESTSIEVVPNKYIRYLYNIIIINYDKFENRKIKLTYQKFTVDKELKQLGFKFYTLYQKTRLEWFKKKAEQIVGLLQNPLGNLKKHMTEEEFESKSQCPKCWNKHSLFNVKGKDASFLLTFWKGQLDRIDIVDLGNISEIYCGSCNFCFFSSPEIKVDNTKLVSSQAAISSSLDYKCDNCNSYDDSSLLESGKQIIVFYDNYELSMKNDEFWNLVELVPKNVGNVIGYQCIYCKHIKKILG